MSPEKPPVQPPETEDIQLTEEEREDQAADEIEDLLDRHENKFLLEHPQNRAIIEDDSITEVERLAQLNERIDARYRATLNVDVLDSARGEEAERMTANIEGVRKLVRKLEDHGKEVGRGGDAKILVIDNPNDTSSKRPTCFKVELEEVLKRGRNTIRAEKEIQMEFRKMYKEMDNKDIGVPVPSYSIDVSSAKILAMEYLNASSVDDILRSVSGRVPEWLDIDRFCDSLENFLDEAHKRGLYHRDMHYGNVMISQRAEQEEGKPLGYIIDFGLSGHGKEGFDPYKKQGVGEVFTYSDDYGTIPTLRRELHSWRKRNS